MRILVLSRDAQLYSTRRLVEAGRERGHTVEVVDYLHCRLITEGDRCRVFSGRTPLDNWDAVIPRVGASRTYFGTSVVQHFESMGTFAANTAEAIRTSRDKLRALQVMTAAGIPTPRTVFAHPDEGIGGLVEAVGGSPVVIKLTEGSRGAGVMLADTTEAAEAILTALHMLEGQVMVQRFVSEAKGRDIRAFVVGDEVVASMVRIAKPGEFRANLHRGGRAKAVQLTDDEQRAAVRATKAMGLGVAGVDFLRGEHGPLFLEVNSSPGLQGIEHHSRADIAGAVIRHLEARVRSKAPRSSAAEDADHLDVARAGEHLDGGRVAESPAVIDQ